MININFYLCILNNKQAYTLFELFYMRLKLMRFIADFSNFYADYKNPYS